jgi:hypothetical protein
MPIFHQQIQAGPLEPYLLDQQLQQLITEARCHPPGHIRRQRCLTAVIRLITHSQKLWREDTPYYADALQQTWLYFCQNVCEATTGERYNASRSSVTTWLNCYLRWRLRDLRTQEFRRHDRQYNRVYSTDEVGCHTWNTVMDLVARPEVPPILEETKAWVRQDLEGKLRRIHVRYRPDVTAQMLILRRLPPEIPWEQLSQEFNLPISTLSSFYQRQCVPLLRNFGQMQGYL